HVRLARLGEHVLGASTLARGLDELLVDELLQRGVDRAGARAPHLGRSLGDCLDDAVAVRRSLRENRQDDGADVTAPRATPSASASATEPGAEGRHPTAQRCMDAPLGVGAVCGGTLGVVVEHGVMLLVLVM